MDVSGLFNYPTADETPRLADEPFLADCSEAEWEQIHAYGETLTMPAGAVVIAEGSRVRALLIVLSGRVEVELTGRRGGRRRVVDLGTGSLLGELGFLDGDPASARVRAREASTFLRLTLEGFDRLAALNPTLGLYLLFDVGRVLAGRLRTFEGLGTDI